MVFELYEMDIRQGGFLLAKLGFDGPVMNVVKTDNYLIRISIPQEGFEPGSGQHCCLCRLQSCYSNQSATTTGLVVTHVSFCLKIIVQSGFGSEWVGG